MHLAETDVDAGKAFREGGQVGVAEMIGDEDFRLDELRRFHALVHGHRVRLVHGQEGYVDVFDIRHFRNDFRVAGNVDTQAVKGEHIAVSIAFRMEILSSFGSIVGGDGFQPDAFGQLQFLAVADDLSRVSSLVRAAMASASRWSPCSWVMRITSALGKTVA